MATRAPIDRQAQPPFLLKLFYRTSGTHTQHEFLPANAPPPPHLQIYTWKNCSLRELTHLLVSALPKIFPDPAIGTRLHFKMFYPDPACMRLPPDRAKFLTKELGSVVVGADEDAGDEAEVNGADKGLAGRPLKGDADKTLMDEKFQAGDYVSVGVFPPLPNGEVAPANIHQSTEIRGRGGQREYSREYRPPGRLDRPPRENGYGGGGGYGRGPRPPPRYVDDFDRGGGVPRGEWSRGEQPPGPGGGSYGGGYRGGRPRGRGW